MSTDAAIQAAAVVFQDGEHDRRALADFARELAASGCRLGGMVQESIFDDQGRRTRIDSVDLATGGRIVINQPGRLPPGSKECTLDTAALADAGTPLRAWMPWLQSSNSGCCALRISAPVSACL